jgi:glutathione S-transferase
LINLSIKAPALNDPKARFILSLVVLYLRAMGSGSDRSNVGINEVTSEQKCSIGYGDYQELIMLCGWIE